MLGAKPLRVALFEQSNRIGGRLLSLAPPEVDTHVEVGGMRYTSEHKYVIALVDHFNLTPTPFPVQEPQNFAYLRGDVLRMADLADASKLPYSFSGDEGAPAHLKEGFTALAAKRLLKELTGKEQNLTEVDWVKIASEYEFEDMSLWDLPLRYLFQRMVSHEAFQFSVDSSGYDSILYTWNGVDGFSWNLADFGPSITYSRLEQGYQQVPLKCAESFENAGGQIHMNHSLISFDCIDLDGGKIVEFTVDNDGNESTHRAKRLILAMPRRSLEMLSPTGAVMDSRNKAVRRLIESVTPIPLFKLALCYDEPWWEKLTETPDGKTMPPITSGESVTDIPIRQFYYWHTDKKTGKAVVLIYDDGTALTYWAGLRSHETLFKGASGPRGENGLPSWDDFPAPARMVEEAHRQIKQMHGVADKDIPTPYAASYKDWGDDPYGGGANFWPVGVRSHEVSRDIIQPMDDMPVYICGEAYSHGQGWVEGALATAEDMLTRKLGLQKPSWRKS